MDASVAARAGSTRNPTIPQNHACREILSEILSVCHRVVLTDSISKEWKRHQFSFFQAWLTNMTSREKVVRVDADEHKNPLRDELRAAIGDQAKLAEALKDAPLLEAALAADRIVISVDERARAIMSVVARSNARLKSVIWVNPERDRNVVDWIKQGAKPERRRRLGA